MKVFLVAGEPSGDKLGAALMAGLHSLGEPAFKGVGGPLMEAQGMESLFPMDELSVMGITEILPKYAHLKRRIRQVAQAVLEAKPDVLVTIDSPDFCFRVAGLVKAKSNIRTVHYVAPTVWAWRSGRAKKMSTYIDHVLALLPFEPPFMEEAGMECDFVGHPVVAERQATARDAADFRAAFGLSDRPVILALPGSRKGEVSRLADTFGAALDHVLREKTEAHVVVPTVAPVYDLVQELTKKWSGSPTILEPGSTWKPAAFKAANVALAASGTVSLELAAAGTPMVIAYDMAWMSRAIISRMLKIDTVTLVNLVSDSRTIPEYIGADCKPQDIAKGLLRVMFDPSAQKVAMARTMRRLGEGGDPPGLRAARAIVNRL